MFLILVIVLEVAFFAYKLVRSTLIDQVANTVRFFAFAAAVGYFAITIIARFKLFILF